MKTLYALITLLLFFNFNISQTVQLNLFANSFNNPVELSHANDDRLFVVEQAGVIKILNANGTVNTTPFLDISSQISSGGERGLLGLAFAPDYSTSGRFYVNYTNTSGNTVISRFNVSANPDVADTNETILLTINQPYTNHNGGKILFGPDNYLYIATGDGGSGGDPENRAQNPNSLLGKLLRIDVSGATYSNPNDNPYFSGGGLPEIWAIGLRNPWKISFDRSNGDLWIADVGQNVYEEINTTIGIGSAGDNYGWRCFEGLHDYNNEPTCPPFSSTINPVNEYQHGNGPNGFRCSITGGYVYRGTNYPSFSGKYFFADYCSAEIGILTESTGSWNLTWQTPNITTSWTSFGEDFNGEMYVVGGNAVYKISDQNLSTNTFHENSFKMYPNPAKNEVNFVFNNENHNLDTINIFDLQGKVVNTIKPSQSINVNIPTNNLSSGFYMVKLTDKNQNSILKKLIIN